MSSLNAERAGDFLSSASSVLVHSGNVASWNKLRRKGVLTPTDELTSTIGAAFTSWLGRQREDDSKQSDSIVFVRNAGLCQKVEEKDALNHIFSLKVFLNQWSPELLRDAVHTTLSELGLSQVNSIILAFPSSPTSELTLDHMTPIWKEAEMFLQKGVAREVGVADLDKDRLEELYNWATVKPKVNQVNVAQCCTIPEDLVEFSKQHDIKLTTHNDDRDILPQESLGPTLSSVLEGCDIDHSLWTPSWVARYSSVIKLRGIIAHKGYLLKLNTGSQ